MCWSMRKPSSTRSPSAMSSALSDRTTNGTAIASGSQSGFDVDIGSMLAGNTIHLTYTDQPGGVQHNVTLVRVDDPKALPLPASATPNANDRVVGIDFSGGMSSIVAQINSALGPSGLQILQYVRHDAAHAR